MWSEPTVTGDFSVNYGDKKPQLSDVVFEVIKYVEDNFDKINPDVLNATTRSRVSFNGSDLKYDSIRLKFDEKNNSPYISFSYIGAGGRNDFRGYDIDITDADYKYLSDYFLKIFKIFNKKDEEKNKLDHASELEKIKEKRAKEAGEKYNL